MFDISLKAILATLIFLLASRVPFIGFVVFFFLFSFLEESDLTSFM